MAGSMAFQDAAKKARPVLLEPVMRVEVVVPKEFIGEVMGDLASRRGRIQSQDDRGGTQIVNARVPLSEMFGYATDLRSRTQGRATYTMQVAQYHHGPATTSAGARPRGRGRRSRPGSSSGCAASDHTNPHINTNQHTNDQHGTSRREQWVRRSLSGRSR